MNREFLKRYFDNTCTPAEREEVTQWLSDPRQREEVLQYMEGEWKESLFSLAELEKAAAELSLPFETLFRLTGTKETVIPGKTGRLPSWRKMTVAAAASCLFLLAGVYIGYHYHHRAPATENEVVYYADAGIYKGQRSRLMLSDGSEIYLNADSRITIPSESNARQVVYLEGEAYFKIPNKEKPLIIKTKDFVASSKGSQFNISAFPKDSTMTVSVEKGKAEISSNTEHGFPPMLSLRIPSRDSTSKQDSAAAKPKVMPMLAIRIMTVQANECVTFDNRSKVAAAPVHLTEEEASAWKDGIIYFRQVDSAELVNKLDRWFDVDVSLNTAGIPLKPHNCGFKNATLLDVLRHIASEQGLEYRIEGRHVYLNRPVANDAAIKK